ncbi:MAG: THUMP domain-containing protein [Nitrososphaerales archaeon]
MSLEEEFNIIATTARGLEFDGLGELWDLFREVGDDKAEVKISQVSGIIIAKTSLNPFDVVEKIKLMVSKDPWKVKNLLRIIPLEANIEAELKAMENKVKELKDRIGKNETFRITVEKRFASLSSRDIIEAIAKHIDRKVDLEEPDWIVLVEIIKDRAGISVLKRSEILSFVKLKKGD